MIPPVESPDEPSLMAELEDCLRQLDEIDIDAGKLVAQLSDNQFHWPPSSSQWSVAQCLLHLVIFNRRYLPNIDETIERAWAENMLSLGPFHYGFVERWLISATEPPPRIRVRTPVPARPSNDQPLHSVMPDFAAVQQELRKRVRAANGLDLARARVTSPFVKSLKMGLGACFSLLAAHERRHVWQAWQVRLHSDFPAQ